MFDLMKKTLLAGLGAAVVTKEKIDNALKGFVDQGKISKEEADRIANDLVQSGEKQWEEIQARVVEVVKNALETLDIGSKKEFVELQQRVENLENRLRILEDTKAQVSE